MVCDCFYVHSKDYGDQSGVSSSLRFYALVLRI